ncbi:hypothetical protein Taro_048281 [Colocasia esculenta]|uniref:Uncharacterized protein n=1 Tax=Colocasia esculenta TaxID=4460 RepID=A0A843X2F8_COLES|nr:hypothetical protein [Colocasia esculenta]
MTSHPRPRSKPPRLVRVDQDTSNTIVTVIVWPDYGPTPIFSRRFKGCKERSSEKRTGKPAPSRTPAVLGVLGYPRELWKRLDAAVLTTISPSTPDSVTRSP